MYEYIHLHLKDHNFLHFFIEGKRSTYGKII